jgi:hypothetical protein
VTVVLFVRSGRDEEETRPAALEWLEQSQAALIPFEPLAPEAVADFIERQLQRAGYRGSPLFTPRAALAIHTETNGVPGAIARLCERLLADAAVRRLRTIDEPFVRSRQDARSLQAEIPGRSGDEGGEAWDDADHHPRETPSEELLLVDAIASPPRPAPRLDAPSDVEADLVRDPELEAYLSAPPTAAELRAIRGGFVRRHLWPFAAVSAAAVLGGLLLARVSWQDPVEPVAEPPSSVGVPTGGTPHAPTNGPVLGRLRGPVIAVPAPDARRPAAPPRASLDPTVQIESPLRQAGDLDDSALPAARRVISARDEDSRPLDLRDDRPKDLAPPAGIDPGIP